MSATTVTKKRQTETEVTKAKRLFVRRLLELPDVRVEPCGGQTIGEQSFLVFIRPGDLDTEYKVYDLEAEFLVSHPDVPIDVTLYEEVPGSDVACLAEPDSPSA